MAKSFTEEERKKIRMALISACKASWAQYGYQKTGIRELSELVGISSGMFYQFFPTKEHLFVETSQSFQAELEELFHKILRAEPNKTGIANCLKEMILLVNQTGWLANLRREWPIIIRKLPEEFVVKEYQMSFSLITKFIEEYQLKSRKTLEEITQIFNILLTMARSTEFIPGDLTPSVDYIIDTVIDELFE